MARLPPPDPPVRGKGRARRLDPTVRARLRRRSAPIASRSFARAPDASALALGPDGSGVERSKGDAAPVVFGPLVHPVLPNGGV